MSQKFVSLEMIAELRQAAQGGCEWSRVQLEELETPLYYWESSETHNADFDPLAGQYERTWQKIHQEYNKET